MRPVRLGVSGRAYAEIREGLAAGEAVVLFPPADLREGTRVAAREEVAAGDMQP